MIKVRFHDSGEIWELNDDLRLTSHWVNNIIDNIRWFRSCFPDKADVFSYAIIEVNNLPYAVIGITEFWISISRYNKDYSFSVYRRCYDGKVY